MLIMEFCYHGSNFRRKFQAVMEYASPPLSKDEALKNIGHSMSNRNLIFGVSSVKVSYMIRFDSLLQNATDVITKCDSCFITKCDRSLLQNASEFLLQNATILLQNATFITNCDSTVLYTLNAL